MTKAPAPAEPGEQTRQVPPVPDPSQARGERERGDRVGGQEGWLLWSAGGSWPSKVSAGHP